MIQKIIQLFGQLETLECSTSTIFISITTKCKDDSFHSVKVSFVLPKDHCLGRNHSAALIDLVTGFMLMDIGELQDMEEEIVSNHLPTNAEVSSV